MLNEALNNPGATRFQGEAIVREIKEKEFGQTSGKPFQRIQLDDGELQRQVKIFLGTGSALTQVHIGQKLQFSISGYVSTFDNKTYLSGFWNRPQGQSPPQQPQQAAPRPPGQPKADWDAITEGKVRHGVLCAMLQGGLIVHYPTVLKHTTFIVTGKIPEDKANPKYSDDPEGPKGDMAF